MKKIDLKKQFQSLYNLSAKQVGEFIAPDEMNFIMIDGYATKPISGGLVRVGGELVGEPMGFCVTDKEGLLKPDELKRAGK